MDRRFDFSTADAYSFITASRSYGRLQMNHLFVLGNKRSGTSVLIRALNSHPGVFIAPEADIAWILYCKSSNRALGPYPEDGPRGFNRTIERYAELIEQSSGKNIAALGDQLMLSIAKEAGKNPELLQWVGDKKPVQHGDPAIFEFLCEIYPDAHFLHIVRHPAAFVQSVEALRVRKNKNPGRFGDLYEFWARNEQRVIEQKARGRVPIHTITYSELTAQPERVLRRLYDALGIAGDADILSKAQGLIESGRDAKHAAYADTRRLPDKVREIVELYGL